MPRLSLEESAEITFGLIQKWIGERGYSPTYRELARLRDLSPTAIRHHMDLLLERGKLTRAGNGQRTWRIAETETEAAR